MSSPMRAVIIGCGTGGQGRAGRHSIAYAHALSMKRSGGLVHLAAAATRTPRNAEAFASEFPGTTMYSDYREMLTAEAPDFVSVCAFPPEREEMVMAAIAAGAKIILAEKPFALNAASAHRMLDAAESAGARIFVNFQRRYGAPFVAAYDAIHSGMIGRLSSVHVVHPGTGFINFGPHLLDTAAGWLAPRNPVRAFAAIHWSESEKYQGVGIEKQLLGTVHYDDGSRLVVESGEHTPSLCTILRADGDQGFVELVLSPEEGDIGTLRGFSAKSGAIKCPVADENFHHGTIETNLYFDRLFMDILAHQKAGNPSRVDAKIALQGIEILEKWTISAKENRIVGW